MNRFGSIAFVVTVTLLCAVALSASPALARQVGPTKVRACTKRLHGKVVKCHRKQAPRRGAPLPGAQLGGPKGHSADAAGAFMRIGDDVNPIAYAAASSDSSSGSSGSSGSAKS
jgi:hypothetical protein